MNAGEARQRFQATTVARLATVGSSGHGPAPHLVPVTFAIVGADTVVIAVDHKPKRTVELRRLENIDSNPAVCLLVDHYEDDWDALWWARADGVARVLRAGHTIAGCDAGLREQALNALASRYQQYALRPPDGSLIVVNVQLWSGWIAAGGSAPAAGPHPSSGA